VNSVDCHLDVVSAEKWGLMSTLMRSRFVDLKHGPETAAAFPERGRTDGQLGRATIAIGIVRYRSRSAGVRGGERTFLRVGDYPLAIRSATGICVAEGPQTAGSASVSKSWRRGLVDVGPAGFLLTDDFGNAGIDFSGEGEEIFEFHVPHLHSVAASQEFDALVG
jgi:hypothetical protein